MADNDTGRDRQIRTEALHVATRLMAAVIASGAEPPKDKPAGDHLEVLTHSYAHYIHAGVWVDLEEGCPFGDTCRFNRKAAW